MCISYVPNTQCLFSFNRLNLGARVSRNKHYSFLPNRHAGRLLRTVPQASGTLFRTSLIYTFIWFHFHLLVWVLDLFRVYNDVVGWLVGWIGYGILVH